MLCLSEISLIRCFVKRSPRFQSLHLALGNQERLGLELVNLLAPLLSNILPAGAVKLDFRCDAGFTQAGGAGRLQHPC